MAKDKKKTEAKKAEKHVHDAPDVKVEDGSSKVSSVAASVITIEEAPSVPLLSPVPEELATEEEAPVEVRLTPEYYEKPILTQLIVERYEGEKVQGLYEGEGTAYFKGGNVYKGMFAEGIMHGRGTYSWTDGVTYEGDFYMNVPMGHGIYTWTDGSKYEGEVKDGMRHGFGMYKCGTRPISYIGQWNEKKRHGKGTIYYSEDGTSWYEGNWVNNVKSGWGIRCYKSGNIYEGQWENNIRHGEGKMRWLTTNEEYTGTWVHGIQHGFGTHTWFLKRIPGSQYPLRNEYIGDFVDGARHGQGKFLYASGAIYEGEWNSNKKHGLGKFIFKNGRIYEGEFQNDLIAEFPHFQLERMNTPDLSGIRTQSPTGYALPLSSLVTLDAGSKLGSNIELDISSLLEALPAQERPLELKQVEYAVLRHITELRRIYHLYSSLGHDISVDNTFLMTRFQFWRFLLDCRFHHYDMTLSDMDRMLNDNAPPELLHAPHETLLLRNFLSYIIHLSFHICQEENRHERLPHNSDTNAPSLSSVPAAVPIQRKELCLVSRFSKIMSENIIPNACNIKGNLFSDLERTVHLVGYINKCWEIYKCHSSNRSIPPYEPTMKMRQFIWMLKDFKMLSSVLTPTTIVDILAADNPAVRDGLDINLDLEITFLEFFEALLSCATVYVTPDVMDKICPLPQEIKVDKSLLIEQPNDSSLQHDGLPQEQPAHPEQPLPQANPENISYETSLASYNSGSSKVESVSEKPEKPKKSEVKPKEHATDEKAPKPASKSGEGRKKSISQGERSGDARRKSVAAQQSGPKTLTEEDKFALWLSQIYIFFVKVFFPAHEQAEHVKEEIPRSRERLAVIERQQTLKAEEEAAIRALKKAEAEQAKRAEEEAERAAAAALAEAPQVTKDGTEETRSGQTSTPTKDEPVVPAPPPATTKQAGTAGKKKKR
ncbi:radial spoke head 10 homolog B isoform X2 [Ambystoma mexicanum]|uniref:radial spoke head 10 homolog B isoform X2 n=1 Tax=Ambystoma mexicanum TaxID=8296 RepID=UPI0037E886AF